MRLYSYEITQKNGRPVGVVTAKSGYDVVKAMAKIKRVRPFEILSEYSINRTSPTKVTSYE